MIIIKDDGTWKKDPSGLKSGNLKYWRDKMYEICPNPKINDIVIIESENNKKYGYRAKNSNGFNTLWERVSSDEIEKHLNLRLVDVKKQEYLPNQEDYIYLCDGVYIHKDDAWF